MASHRQLLAVLAMGVVQTVAQGQSANHVIGMQSFCVGGEPFSATQTLDYEPTDGASDPVAVHREGTLYRDSKGRMRTELKYPGYMAVFIQDCVTHVLYDWTVGDGKRDMELRCGDMKRSGMGTVTDNTPAPLRPNEQVVLIEGVETRHSRSVREKEGKVELIYEHWYAPSLHVNLLQVTYGGDLGKTTHRIFNLKMDEPDAALFQIPDGFTSRSSDCPAPPGAAESYSTIDGNWRLTGAWAEKLGRGVDISLGVDGNRIYGEGQFPMSCVSGDKSSVMGREVSIEGGIASDGTFILSNPSRMPPDIPAHVVSIRGKLPVPDATQWSGSLRISAFTKTSNTPAECQEISADFVAMQFPVLNGVYEGTVRVDRNEEAYVTLELTQGKLASTNFPYPFDHVIPLAAKITASGSPSLPSDTFDASAQPQENNRVTGKTFQVQFLGGKDGASFGANGSIDPSDESRLTLNLVYATKDESGKFRFVHASGRLTRQ
jgi:hypothetical protein